MPPRNKTINLPYATWKQLKLLAIDRDMTMHQLVQVMLDEQPKQVVPSRSMAKRLTAMGVPAVAKQDVPPPETAAYDLATGDMPWDLSEDK